MYVHVHVHADIMSTHRPRHGGDLIVTERDDNKVFSFDHVLRHFSEAVVTEVKGHQFLHFEQVGRETRVSQRIVTRIHHLWVV